MKSTAIQVLALMKTIQNCNMLLVVLMSSKLLVNPVDFTCRYRASFALKIVKKQMQIMKPGALSILSELAKGYLKSQVFFYSMVTGIISEKEQCCLVGALFFISL